MDPHPRQDEESPLVSFHPRRVSSASNNSLPVEPDSLVENLLSAIGFGPFQLIAFSLAGLTYFAFACEVLTFTFISMDVSEEWGLDGVTFAILPAATCLTNILGGILFGYLSDRYGRIWPYAVCMAIIGVFILASAASKTYWMLIVLRAVTSVGIGGIISMLHPMLIEFLPVRYRGKVTILTGFVQGIGSCVAGCVAWWLVPRYKDGWRLFTVATAIPSLFILVFRLIFWVESPRYLISCNKAEETWKTFSLIASFNRKTVTSIINKNDFLRLSKLHVQATSNVNKSSVLSMLKKFTHVFKQPYRIRTICILVIYNTQQLAYFGLTLFLPVILTSKPGC